MKLSDGEKLILVLLGAIAKELKITDPDPRLIIAAILSGHTWALKEELPGVFEAEEQDRAAVREVNDILDMWWFIEMAHKRLSAADKKRVKKEAAPYDAKFQGFDGNSEPQFGTATFLIKALGRFSELGDRSLNSNMPVVPAYRRMLKKFSPMRSSLSEDGLTAEQIIELLLEQKHPS